MALPNNFRELVEVLVKDRLELLNHAIPESKKYKQIWKFEHESDFFYGHMIGNIEGAATVFFMNEYNRKLTMDEINEVKEIIEVHAKEFRDKIYL